MSYAIEITPSCEESIKKHCRKNHSLETTLKHKVEEILENPTHYKPLKYALSGLKRVHILKSYILIFEIREKTVVLIFFGHHDEAYKR
jgi:YafQ family addiction module toxin component